MRQGNEPGKLKLRSLPFHGILTFSKFSKLISVCFCENLISRRDFEKKEWLEMVGLLKI
jgi:hypothetical protein